MSEELIPELRCNKGHIIPANKTAVKRSGGYVEFSDSIDRNGKTRKNSLIACEECALAASKGMPKEPAKISALNRARHPHADQTVIDVPVIFIS